MQVYEQTRVTWGMNQWDYNAESPSPCGPAGTGSLPPLDGPKAIPVDVLGIANT